MCERCWLKERNRQHSGQNNKIEKNIKIQTVRPTEVCGKV